MAETCTECPGNVIKMYKKRSRTIRIKVNGFDSGITGADIWFSIKAEEGVPDDDALVLKKNLANGGGDDQAMVTDGANGIFEIYIVPDDTDDLRAGDYIWDAVIRLDNKTHQVVPPATFKILQPVTLT